MSKRPDRFVVGLLGKSQVVYGRDDETYARYAEPMTLAEARQGVEELSDGPAVIYELVVKERRRKKRGE